MAKPKWARFGPVQRARCKEPKKKLPPKTSTKCHFGSILGGEKIWKEHVIGFQKMDQMTSVACASLFLSKIHEFSGLSTHMVHTPFLCIVDCQSKVQHWGGGKRSKKKRLTGNMLVIWGVRVWRFNRNCLTQTTKPLPDDPRGPLGIPTSCRKTTSEKDPGGSRGFPQNFPRL